MNNSEYLKKLQEIGVRTDKRIEVMYCDLFRITENIFLKECHAREAFELDDLIEKEEFQYLHELRKHMEDLMQWMFPKGLPPWPVRVKNQFERMVNPYLSANLKAVSNKTGSKSNMEISALFNLRCGKSGAQFQQDREFLLKKLETGHFSLAAIKEYMGKEKDNSAIPALGLDLIKQEVYLLGDGKSFLSKEVEKSCYSNAWYAKYMKIFNKFHDTRLTAYYNQQVDRDNSSMARLGILKALREQFYKREIDFSSIKNKNCLDTNQCVVLVGKKLHTITEVPHEIAEGLAMMYLKDGRSDGNYKNLKITSVDEENINFLQDDYSGYVQANAAIQSFYKQLLNSSKKSG
jgi:hypothetical protein